MWYISHMLFLAFQVFVLRCYFVLVIHSPHFISGVYIFPLFLCPSIWFSTSLPMSFYVPFISMYFHSLLSHVPSSHRAFIILFAFLPYLTLPYLTLPYLTLPYLTYLTPYLTSPLPYLTLLYLTLPLPLPYLTLPYPLSLPYFTLPNFNSAPPYLTFPYPYLTLSYLTLPLPYLTPYLTLLLPYLIPHNFTVTLTYPHSYPYLTLPYLTLPYPYPYLP